MKITINYLKKINRIISNDNNGNIIKTNVLIFIVAFGPEYQKQALMLIKSLKIHGLFNGEIICLIDKCHIDLNVKTIKVNGIEPMKLRMYADYFIDFCKYDKIIYLDADIICVNRLDKLLISDKLLYTEEQWNNEGNLTFFNDNEKHLFRNGNGINSGIFCINSNMIIKLLKLWREIHDQLKFKKLSRFLKYFSDQAAFNYIIRKQLIENEALNFGIIDFPHNKIKNKDRILIHYTSNKKLMEDDYKRYNLI